MWQMSCKPWHCYGLAQWLKMVNQTSLDVEGMNDLMTGLDICFTAAARLLAVMQWEQPKQPSA